MKKISIVIPTLNNRAQINELSHGLNAKLGAGGIDHKIICFDRGSTDGTVEYLLSLQKIPIETERVAPGQKLTKILISHPAVSGADYIAIIDPNYLQAGNIFKSLLQSLSNQDILLATTVSGHNRETTYLGVGIFKKEIFMHLLDVYQGKEQNLLWSLNQYVKHFGYNINYHYVEYADKTNYISRLYTFWLRTKLFISKFPPYHYPPTKKGTMVGAGIHHHKRKFITHTTLHHRHSAVLLFSKTQNVIVYSIVGLLLLGLLLNWHRTLLFLFSLLVVLYFADLFFNFFLVIRSFLKQPEIVVTDKEIRSLSNEALPIFSVLCPLYKEEAILLQFINAMTSLDYPKDKLEVLLLLEEDDLKTIEMARKLNPPAYIKLLIVPDSLPRTKPKALNWGLAHAKGEFIVIYDAEDIPEKDQLKKAVIAFDKAGRNAFCLQAKLNFYNPKQNLLTCLFTAEYSMWFDLVLTGLYSIAAPIPLGGTSNFFRRKDIVSTEGWDAFNVCEDCDLGLRLFKRGHRTVLFNSTTYEEANSNLHNWIRQRSHWIKGYIQSFFVHLRSPGGFMRSLGQPHLFTFLLIVGGKTLSVFINPLLWTMTVSYFLFRPLMGSLIESFYPQRVFYMGVFTLILGNFFYFYHYILGCARRRYWHLVIFCFLVPIYWLLMSFAAWKALYQLIVKPYFWEKTHHGLHLKKITGLGSKLQA